MCSHIFATILRVKPTLTQSNLTSKTYTSRIKSKNYLQKLLIYCHIWPFQKHYATSLRTNRIVRY